MQDQETPQPPTVVVEKDTEQTSLASGSIDEQATPALRASRKREREVSIEPQTPKGDDIDELSTAHEPRETKAAPAAKKNRLEVVDEGESPPRSPALDHPTAGDKSTSTPNTPPSNHNANANSPTTPSPKDLTADEPTQHIRKKVKEMSWKENGSPARGPLRPRTIYDTAMEDAQEEEDLSIGEVLIDQSVSVPVVQNEDTVIPDAKHHTDIEDTDVVLQAAHAHTVESQQTHADVPFAEPVPAPSLEPSGVPIGPNGAASEGSSGHHRANSESDPPSDTDISKSPSRKRKLGTRESNFANDSRRRHEEYSKRVRDEEGAPKTVAPEKVEEEEPQERSSTPIQALAETAPISASPRSSGFAGFSGASPFAKLGGGPISAPKPLTPQPTPSFSSGFGAFISTASPFAAVASTTSSVFGASSEAPQRATSPEPTLASAIPLKPSPNHLPNNDRSRSPSVSSLNRRKSPPPAGTKPKPGAAFGSYSNATNFGFGSVPSSSGFGLIGGSGSGGGFARHSPSPSLDAIPSRRGSIVDGDDDDGTPPPATSKAGEPTRSDSMKRGASWNEMLGAGADGSDHEDGKEKKKPKVEVIEVLTGEENEDTRYQVRAKLYILDVLGAYKERGLGLLKINVRKDDGSGARLVMRADAVHRLILNAALFPGMAVTNGPDPKYVKLASMENGKAVHYAIRVGNPKAAQDLYDKILEHIPIEHSATPPASEV